MTAVTTDISEPRRLGAQGHHEHRVVRQVLQRPHHRRVRARDLGRGAEHGETAGAPRAARTVGAPGVQGWRRESAMDYIFFRVA